MSHNFLVMWTKLKAEKKIIRNVRKNSDPYFFNLKSSKQILVSQGCFFRISAGTDAEVRGLGQGESVSYPPFVGFVSGSKLI